MHASVNGFFVNVAFSETVSKDYTLAQAQVLRDQLDAAIGVLAASTVAAQSDNESDGDVHPVTATIPPNPVQPAIQDTPVGDVQGGGDPNPSPAATATIGTGAAPISLPGVELGNANPTPVTVTMQPPPETPPADAPPAGQEGAGL